MNPVDTCAAASLFIGASSLALRGYLLKPNYQDWVTAPRIVSFGLVALAILEGGGFLSIAHGGHATAREAVLYAAHAVVAALMLANLARQKQPGPPPEPEPSDPVEAVLRMIRRGR